MGRDATQIWFRQFQIDLRSRSIGLEQNHIVAALQFFVTNAVPFLLPINGRLARGSTHFLQLQSQRTLYALQRAVDIVDRTIGPVDFDIGTLVEVS